MNPNLDILVVNWNSGDHLKRCVESVLTSSASAYTLGKVIIVDNGSTDGSTESIEFIDQSVLVVRNQRNLGFGVACNIGADLVSSEYLLFLNPDVVLTKDALDTSIEFMSRDSSKQVGICGIKMHNAAGVVHRSCGRVPKAINFISRATGLCRVSSRYFPDVTLDEFDHESSMYVPHVIGAFYLMRRTVFQDAGGFDSRFFVYLEDLDLSIRVGSLGWGCFYLSAAHATHVGGGTSANAKAAALFYSIRSRLIYSRKHFSTLGALGVFVATLTIEPLARLGQALFLLNAQQARDSWFAYQCLLRTFSDCWRLPVSLDSVARPLESPQMRQD